MSRNGKPNGGQEAQSAVTAAEDEAATSPPRRAGSWQERQTSTQLDIVPPLAAWVAQVMEHASFTGGAQQDAAECLMHILLGVDGGEMQRRVCGASAAASVEGMILCEIAGEAQVTARCKTLDEKKL